MTKRVREAEAFGVRINETDLAILRELARRTGGEHRPVTVTCRELCAVVNRCEVSVRLSIRTIDETGLVRVCHRHLSNGGQIENEYEITELGYQIIDAASSIPSRLKEATA